MIEITRREIDRAYRDHSRAAQTLSKCSFSGLTCLFYSAECGLKSILMKREHKSSTNWVEKYEHDLNKMLDALRCEKNLRLPDNFILDPLKQSKKQRNATQRNSIKFGAMV